MRTPEELDRMHDDVVRRYPGGLTPLQFRIVTLESADENGKVYPHSVADWFRRQSMLFAMSWKEGLIESKNRHDEPYDWRITDKGREWLAEQTAAAR